MLLESYLKYVEVNPISKRYARWAMLSCISACLERRVWIDNGNYGYLYPNTYTLLVGRSGSGKSASIKQAVAMVKQANPTPHFSPVQITPAALVQELQTAEKYYKHDRRQIPHSSVFVVASELAKFFRDFGGGSILMELMDYYDSPGSDKPEKYEISKRTKKDDYEVLKNPSLTLLAGSTPDYLSVEVAKANVGKMGLDSRIIFVVDSNYYPKMISFERGDPVLEKRVVTNLNRIMRLQGPMIMDDGAKKIYAAFIDELNGLCSRYSGSASIMEDYYTRKDTNVMKVAMCVSAARSSDLRITREDMEITLDSFREIEPDIVSAYGMRRLNDDPHMQERIYSMLTSGTITEPELLALIRKEMASFVDFDGAYKAAIDGLLGSGRITESYNGMVRVFKKM